MTQTRLCDPAAIFQLTAEVSQIGQHLRVDGTDMVRHDTPQKYPAEARSGVAGKFALSECHTSGRRVGPGAIDLEFGQHHNREGTCVSQVRVSRPL